MDPTALSFSRQLLVEGAECKLVMERLLLHGGIVDVQVHDFGGISELRAYLRTFAKTPGFDSVTSLAIVRDAETSYASAEASVSDALASAGLPGPSDVDGALRTTIFILPDQGSPGMLEDLCLSSVAGDPALECADSLIVCLEERGVPFGTRAKARAHAFLASRPRPQAGVGRGAVQGYWDFSHDAFRKLLQMLDTF
jgi:hypothetical protein